MRIRVPSCPRHDRPERGCGDCAIIHQAIVAHALLELGRGVPPRGVLPLPCVHEGPIIESCATCNKASAENNHVRHCLHPAAERDSCVRDNPRSTLQSCARCTDRQLRPQPRHLLYHVYPVRGNGVWQLNLERLRQRLPLFDGRRVIAIATDARSDAAAAVRDHLAGERIDEWVETGNDPRLREMKTWPLLWQRVAGQSGFVFYAHAKGVTRPANAGTTIHRWADLLYRANLDHWPAIESLLTTRPIAGAFKKIGLGFRASRSAWHFSGSFYWLRLDAVGERWRHGDTDRWHGVESWPGIHWAAADAGSVFGEGTVSALDLYKMRVLIHWEREYEAWRLATTAGPSITG